MSDIDDLYNKSKELLNNQQEKVDEYAALRDNTDNNEISHPSISNTPINNNQNIENTSSNINPSIEDGVLFPGGPTKAQLELWKKQFTTQVGPYRMGKVFVVEIQDFGYVILRTLRRGEYLQINGYQNLNAYTREETIAHECCLFPVLEYEHMHELEAGIPATIAQIVMENSGFVKDYKMEVL